MTNKSLDYYMALPYPILLIPEEDGSWFAEIPLLPGCMTQGDSWADIFEMIQDARRAWLESALADGDPIPEPQPRESQSRPRPAAQTAAR